MRRQRRRWRWWRLGVSNDARHRAWPSSGVLRGPDRLVCHCRQARLAVHLVPTQQQVGHVSTDSGRLVYEPSTSLRGLEVRPRRGHRHYDVTGESRSTEIVVSENRDCSPCFYRARIVSLFFRIVSFFVCCTRVGQAMHCSLRPRSMIAGKCKHSTHTPSQRTCGHE